MPADPSIYGNLFGGAPQNPMDVAKGALAIQGQGLQNRLLGAQAGGAELQLRANQAMGPIMQQSVGPDGQVDYAKAATLMASNPNTAFMAPDFLTKVYQGQGLQLQNQLHKLDVMAKEQGAFGNAAGSLLPLGEAVTTGDISKRMSSLWSDLSTAGLADGKMQDRMITFMASLPQSGKDIHQMLQQMAMQSSGAADSLTKVTGAFNFQDAGPNIHIFKMNPFTGQHDYVDSIAKAPTVGEMNAPTQTVDQQGNTHVAPAVSALPMVNGAGQQINAPGGQVAMGGGVAAGAAPVTKLNPFATGQFENMGQYAKQLNQDVSGIQTQLQMTQQLQDLLKQFKPGAGSTVAKKLGEVAQAVGMPDDVVNKIGNGDLAATQAFEKYSVQNTMNVLRQAIGGQGRLTNLEFEQFLHSNPNLDTDPRAIEKILNFSQKIYGVKLKEQQAFQIYQHDLANPNGQLAKQGKTIADFPADWTQEMQKRGLLREAKPADLSQKASR